MRLKTGMRTGRLTAAEEAAYFYLGLYFLLGFLTFGLVVFGLMTRLVDTLNPNSQIKTIESRLGVYDAPAEVLEIEYPGFKLLDGDCYRRAYLGSEVFIKFEKWKGFTHIPHKDCSEYK